MCLFVPGRSDVLLRPVCSADTIYEDVQRDGGPLDADNGWSSSEFESYDEHSDNETKRPARSKVACAGAGGVSISRTCHRAPLIRTSGRVVSRA